MGKKWTKSIEHLDEWEKHCLFMAKYKFQQAQLDE